MKRYGLVMAAATLFLSACATVTAGTAADDVVVSDTYARAVPPGQPNSASFLTLTNNGEKAHALVAAKSPVSKVVELHTHTMEGGMMRMRRVEKIDLPAGQATKLQPGGLHIMLIGLHQQLKEGDKVPLTLVFEDGSETDVTAPVRKLRMKMKKGMKMEHKMEH
ncbi:MAG TPA: copper chaperone PCu(A)C [Chromatiales bacterium]|nr:copper chaperone PCu(A)C [Chromatiales bacterium]